MVFVGITGVTVVWLSFKEEESSADFSREIPLLEE